MGAVFLILRKMSSEKLLRDFCAMFLDTTEACSPQSGCRLQRQLLIAAFLLMYACWMNRSTEYDDGGQDA
jgi:hypothetical protein